MKRQYNKTLFWMGFVMNLTKNVLLLLPGIVLCLIGLWVRPCLYIGAALLAIDVVFSLIEQLRIKKTVETSTNPNFEPWAEIMSKDNWSEALINAVNEKTAQQRSADPGADQQDAE